MCFRKFWVSKNFMPKRGISPFSIENLLSHSTEKFRRGTLLCCVSENFKKFIQTSIRPLISVFYAKGYHDFPSKIFRLTMPKSFIGEPFSVSLFSVIEEFYASEGYVRIFRRELFVSQCQNIS